MTAGAPEMAVYGIRVAGLGGASDGPAPPDWDRWTFDQAAGAAEVEAGTQITASAARVGVPGVGALAIERSARTITLHVPRPWRPAALLHPGLSPAAAIIGHWAGRACLHAAAVTNGGAAWGLLGARGAGKSTTAAGLVADGAGLLTDDLLVVEDSTAFAGPGSLDLREDAATRFGGRPVPEVGGRDRWRLAAPRAALTAPLAGWIVLAWGDGAPATAELPPAERVRTLAEHAWVPLRGDLLLALADLRMIRLTRPPGLDALAATIAAASAAMA